MPKKIYFKLNTEVKSVKGLLSKLYASNVVGNSLKSRAEPTYIDKECTFLECKEAYRSFEDLLTICRTYLPDTTEVELMRALKELNMKFWRCPDINKIVFFFAGVSRLDNNKTLTSYASIDSTYSEGTYTPKDLLNIYNQLDG